MIARSLGFPPQFGQSQFAITRGNAFESMVKANGCAELLALVDPALIAAVLSDVAPRLAGVLLT